MPRTLARAGHLVTDSEFVRGEIINRFGVAPGRVTAIPLGVEAVYRPRTMEECQAVFRRYGLEGGRYLLSVSALEPRKNLEGLVDAYSRLPGEIRDRYPLVLTGPKGWLTESLEKRVAPLVRRGEVRQTGFVSAENLPFLYSAAAGFASPSFYEGFGLPVLEAMAMGLPVAGSISGGIVELLGHGKFGLLFERENISDLAQCLVRYAKDAALRSEMGESARQAALEYTSRRMYERIQKVYQDVLTERV